MRFDEGYGVMEVAGTRVPTSEVRNVGYSKDLDVAKEIADKGEWRYVVEMWKGGGVWHFGATSLYRSSLWPR